MTTPAAPSLGWFGIARLGLVNAAIGAIVVLMTSTLNRVMVVELRLAASVPGVLLGLHYALQALRPRWGHGADAGRRTPWIIGGMALLALGGTLAAAAVAVMWTAFWPGIALAVAGFVLIGIGVGAAGTALLTLLADRVAAERRPAAAAIVWMMMIAGFIVSTIAASIALTPFGFARLIELTAATGLIAFAVTVAATAGLERGTTATAGKPTAPPFREALAAVWADAPARRFTLFIFISMLAYSAQDLILEPFAGLVFGLTPAQTTAITSLQNGGTLVGMMAVALLGRRVGGTRAAGMRVIVAAGCLASAAALAGIATAGLGGITPLLRPSIAGLGVANGVFAIAAIGLMMTLAGGAEEGGGAGVRMGVWGAAQAIAFGGGGFAGTLAVDAARLALGATVPAYALVFLVEAALFVAAAAMMRRTRAAAPRLLTMLAAE